MEVVAGQITRLVEVSDPRTGAWHLAAEVATENGPILGRLMAPANGGRGQVGFEPVEAWQASAGGPVAADATPPVAQAQGVTPAPAGSGVITSAGVPIR